MSQDMSTFFTGVRHHYQDRVPKTRTAAKPQGVQANRKRRPQIGAGEGAGVGARARAGQGTGAGVVAAFDRRRPVTMKRLTGGGGGPIPTGIFQTTAPGPRPPTMVSMGAPRRCFRQIEWIMKPSKNFVQCSESSSEDCRPDGVLELQEGRWRKGRTRSSSSSSSNSSSSSSSSSRGCSGASESVSKARLESTNLSQKLVNLLKSSCRPEEPLVRPKKRSSRVFCVPTQRIMHSEELLQAQLLQMRPRRNKLMQRYGHNPTSRILTSKSFKETAPKEASSRNSSPRNASPKRTSPRNASPKDASLIHQALQKTLVQSNETENPYLASLPASPKPSQSGEGDHPLTRSHSQAGDQPPIRSHSLCSIEKPLSSSTISSLSSSSCPSQITLAKPATRSNCSISSNNSSLSTSGTECSVERMTPRYRGTGSKAIKLTSTVIKIMPNKAKRRKHLSKSKLRSKTNSLCQTKGAKDPAMNAPLSQPIAPPLNMPKLKMSKLSVGQSVNQMVNQLTAQLRKAVGEDLLTLPAKKKDLATPKEEKESLKLDRKTSIYLLMDQAKSDQIRGEPLTTKSDWVIQPMKQQMISAAQDQAKKDGSERLNPYMSDSKEAIGHNYDIYLNTPGDRGDREPKTPRGEHSRKHPLPSSIPSRNTFHNQTHLPLSQGSLWCRPRTQRSSLIAQPVSLNRIPRPRLPAVPVPEPQQQPRQVQQQVDLVTAAAGGKIVRKAQHKVPRTMEDGIDMSYQYFVSIPLKRGRKPQVVRYLYRPMVRHLNGVPPANRRFSRRAKRRRAATGSLKLEEAQQKLDPDLAALGGAPLRLEDAPKVEAKKDQPKKKPTFIYDPEAALNSPYKVPPLKLKSRYMPMLEQLEQMPFPDEHLNRRRRSPQRRARAVGGSEQLPPPPTEYQDHHQPLQSIGGGGGDVMAEDEGHHTPVIVWSGRTAQPVPRTSVVNYQAKPTRLCTATGAPILYHQPLLLTLKEVDCKPMIRTITYESIEEEDDGEEEMWQGMQLRLEKGQQGQQGQENQETISMPKSVSFHPEPVILSRGSTSAFQSISSSSSCSSISSSSIEGTRSQSKKGKGRKGSNKGKGKNRGKGKVKGRK